MQRFTYTFLAFLLTFSLFAQNPERIIHQKWEGGPLYTLAQYQGDLGNGRFSEFNSGFGILLRKHFSDNIALRTTFFQSKLSGNDKHTASLANRGFSFSSPVTDWNVLLEYDFLGKKRYKNHYFTKIISPYVSLGTGLAFINPKTNYNEANNSNVLSKIQEDKNAAVKKTVASISYGFGVKFDVNNGWALNIDVNKRLPFSDKIDGVKMSANPKKSDAYCFTSVGLIYRFRKKNDKDRDGVADKDDFCPNKYGNPMLAGCPDRDGDLVPDKDDLCPMEAGERSLSGCPMAKPSYEVQIIKESKLK